MWSPSTQPHTSPYDQFPCVNAILCLLGTECSVVVDNFALTIQRKSLSLLRESKEVLGSNFYREVPYVSGSAYVIGDVEQDYLIIEVAGELEPLYIWGSIQRTVC